MIDNVIKIFDYIYIVSNSKKGENQNFKENEKELNNLIESETGEDINYFWDEYSFLFNEDTLYFCEIDNGSLYIYNPFPRLKLSSKIEYLNFKVKQLKYLIENNGEYDLENLEKDLNINNSIALKSLIEHFINEKLLIANNDEWYKKYIDGSYGFNYEHLKINMNHFNEDDSDIFNSSNKQKQQQSYTDNSTNIYVGKGNFKGNDFSKNKTEIERENIFVKIVNSITKIFKK